MINSLFRSLGCLVRPKPENGLVSMGLALVLLALLQRKALGRLSSSTSFLESRWQCLLGLSPEYLPPAILLLSLFIFRRNNDPIQLETAFEGLPGKSFFGTVIFSFATGEIAPRWIFWLWMPLNRHRPWENSLESACFTKGSSSLEMIFLPDDSSKADRTGCSALEPEISGIRLRAVFLFAVFGVMASTGGLVSLLLSLSS